MKINLTDRQVLIIAGKICPYCLQPTQYVDSEVIYGKSHGMIYLCSPCDAYVGVHRGTDIAKGRLSNKALRVWKKEAHKYFDHIWKNGIMDRKEAYKWLSHQLNLPSEYTHIGMFSIKTCQWVIALCKTKIRNSVHKK